MNCEQATMYLDAYLDDELDVANAAAFEAHAAGCAPCTQAVEQRRRLITRAAAGAPYFRAPATLRERVMRDIGRPGGTVAAPTFRIARWRTPFLLAAAILLAALTPILVRSALVSVEARSMARDVVGAHARSLMASHLIDVASSDRHTVKPWFSGKVPFAPLVPDLKDQGFELVGGRLDLLGGRAVGAVVYRIRQHNIDVFMWDAEPGAGEQPPAARMLEGFSLVHWVHNGLECWAISDTDPETLGRLAKLVRDSGDAPGAQKSGGAGT